MRRLIVFMLIMSSLGVGCGHKSIPQTRKGRKKATTIHKLQYDMHPSYKKKK